MQYVKRGVRDERALFLEFYKFDWSVFERSKSLRKQYEYWKDGKIAIGAVIITDTKIVPMPIPI